MIRNTIEQNNRDINTTVKDLESNMIERTRIEVGEIEIPQDDLLSRSVSRDASRAASRERSRTPE